MLLTIEQAPLGFFMSVALCFFTRNKALDLKRADEAFMA